MPRWFFGAGAKKGQGEHRWFESDRAQACGKRCYTSARAATEDNRNSRFRFTVYWCYDCKSHHVRNAEKR